MTGLERKRRIADEVETIRSEYAEEESEAADVEIAERNATLEVPLNLRIDKDLENRLRTRAAAAQIPVSALVRRLLREALSRPEAQGLTVEQVEQIARRVFSEAS